MGMNRPNGADPRRSRNPQGGNPDMRTHPAPDGQRPKPVRNASPNPPRQSAQRGTLGAQKSTAPTGKRILQKPIKKKKPQSRSMPKAPERKPQQNPRRTKPAPQPKAPERKAQSPRPEISKKASAAAAKAMNTKHAAPTRQHYRGGNYILYYLLFALIVIVVLIILANTVLFNCKEIEVVGMSRYLPDQVIDASKIRKGDNLLHIDKNEAAEKIVKELAYVDAAQVEKSFPTKIVITVTESEKWFCISQFGVNAIISRGGKILEKGSPGDLPVITGYEAESLETGTRLASKVEGKQSIPEEILNAADKAGVTGIDSIDMTDRYSIKVLIDGRITLELGPVTKIDSKMAGAYKLITNEIPPSENVTVLLTNPEKIAVRPNQPNEPIEPVEPSQSEPTSSTPESSTTSE